jgi:hypothetical protein
MFVKRLKRKIFNLFRNLYHKNEKENIKDISLIRNDDELNLQSIMFMNNTSNILSKWITNNINNLKFDRQNHYYENLFYNDEIDNMNYNTLDDLSYSNNKNRKETIKKSPISIYTSIALIGITSGLILSQFLFPGVC